MLEYKRGKDVNDPVEPIDTEIKSKALDWIRETLVPHRHRRHISSYRLKHYMEKEIGIYVTNGEFKWLMMKAGFDYDNVGIITRINWLFKFQFNKEKMKQWGGEENYLRLNFMA